MFSAALLFACDPRPREKKRLCFATFMFYDFSVGVTIKKMKEAARQGEKI